MSYHLHYDIIMKTAATYLYPLHYYIIKKTGGLCLYTLTMILLNRHLVHVCT